MIYIYNNTLEITKIQTGFLHTKTKFVVKIKICGKKKLRNSVRYDRFRNHLRNHPGQGLGNLILHFFLPQVIQCNGFIFKKGLHIGGAIISEIRIS